jgi:hypothetical protein
MMKYHPRSAALWAGEWIDKALGMGAGRPKIDFTNAIANIAHGLIRRTNGSMAFWMAPWVSPTGNRFIGMHDIAEDAVPVLKDFMSDIIAGAKSVDSQPNGETWDTTAEVANFQNLGDEDAFKKVSKAFVANYNSSSTEKSGGGRGKGGGGRGRGYTDRNDRNFHDPKSASTKRCDAKTCPGLVKQGVANEIYNEILKKNPNIKLCVTCYVRMLRDKTDVDTFNNGTMKFRDMIKKGQNTNRANLSQVIEGKGSRVLVWYNQYAQTLAQDSTRRVNIQNALSALPTSTYQPDKNSEETTQPSGSDAKLDLLMARLSKLESAGSTEKVAVQTAAGSMEVGELEVQQAEKDKQRKEMIEEWFAIQKKGSAAHTAGSGAKSLSEELAMFKALGANNI